MPPTDVLLAQLSNMAHALAPLALAWHILAIGIVLAISAGWRPSQHYGVMLLSFPALSVAFCSLAFGNPVNGISFGTLGVSLAMIGGARNYRAIESHTRWTRGLGAGLILFALAYPHFAAGVPVLYSPIGILPCPTLALLAGFALLADGFDTPAVPALLTAWCAFYALFGIAKLGVWIDIGLFAGAGGMAALVGRAAGRPHAPLAHG